jgi:hypothetical protein
MPKYQIKTSGSADYAVEYTFCSIKEAKTYFCNKILTLDYQGGDGFTVSSKYFEEMGVLLSKYSNEKCYAIKSLAYSIYDYSKWGSYNYDSNDRTNKEIIGEYFLESLHKKCEQLFNKLNLHVKSNDDIYMPNICCEAGNNAQDASSFHCSKDLYLELIGKIGCSDLEDVCEGNYDTFKSDL